MRTLIATLVFLVAPMFGATYYVSQSTGLDTNPGTQAQPWQTLAKVNSRTFQAGDSILLMRGDTWREPLVPPSSGTSGAPITFDAYGVGPAPKITGYYVLDSGWSQASGNIWRINLPGWVSTLTSVSFGGLWGISQATPGADRQWSFTAPTLSVYATGNPVTYYGEPIVAIVLSGGTNQQPITIKGKSYLTFQHLELSWFDYAGVNVTGASDHLVFANMAANGMVPAGTTPHGFYVSASPGPGDIRFINDDANMNYSGFRFDGTAAGNGAIKLQNCVAFGNRNVGLEDNTGKATYEYSHFYANNITTIYSQDVVAGAGAALAGNIGGTLPGTPSYVDPQVAQYRRYDARDTFTVDDIGLYDGTEAYINANVLPVFTAYGAKFGAAVTAGYTVDTTSVQNWLNAGHDINSHSWSHQYFDELNAINLQYIGTGTAATVSFDGTRLTTSVTGGPGGENLNLDVTNPSYDTIGKLVGSITTNFPAYSATAWVPVPNDGQLVRTVAHSVGLANVSGQDIKTTQFTLQFDKQRLMNDELGASKAWLNSNISGLDSTFYVYPDGKQDAQTQSWAVATGYTGARGQLSMGGALGNPFGANEVASKAINVQNIVSLAAAPWGAAHGTALTQAQFDARVAALVFKQRLWGYPAGLFVHAPDLNATEVGYLLAGLQGHGATLMRNSDLQAWISSRSLVPGTTGTFYQSGQTGPDASFARLVGSLDQGVGEYLGAAYQYDINGKLRGDTNWDIGAYSAGAAPGSRWAGARWSGGVTVR